MDNLNIGRASDNDLVLTDDKVSRYHARMYSRSGRWYIVDLQSTHGTTVNGEKVQGPIRLSSSDSIKVSDVELVFDGRNILSERGKILISLYEPFQPAMNSSPGKSSIKNNTAPAIAIIAGTILVFAAVLLLLVNNSRSQLSETMPEVPVVVVPDAVFAEGTIEYRGGEYTGELRNGVPHGHGTWIYKSSVSLSFHDLISPARAEKYIGEWRYGQKHGLGQMINPDGTIVEGYWENDAYVGPSGN